MNARTPKPSVKWEAFHILVTVPGVFAQPSGCGEVLTATSDYKDLTSTIGYRNMRENEDFEKCTYWIEAPEGTRIEVRIDSISGSYAVDGCPYFGVEIKSQLDQKATGYSNLLQTGVYSLRFCAREDAGVTLMSHSNRVPIITYTREGQTDVRLKYRYVSNGKPTPQPKSTTAAPVTTTKAQPRFTTHGPRPTIIFTSKPLPGIEGGNGFDDFDFSGFDKFFCRDMPSCKLMVQRSGCSQWKRFCPKICGLFIE
ncbi:hypothetical protein ANCDUO_12175 [Ancylostoma duodenale]|uniref:CUB domain-containing protein n=1 Tax=Ancylostoma duodenale TaxID=51022 RepID=A0A0C2G9I7_9BILA|nr:hypothetical protein ANCDUO_12175 [Ancylostoma duodenale]